MARTWYTVVLLALLCHAGATAEAQYRGRQFLGLTQFTNFASAPTEQPADQVSISPTIQPQYPWNELILSWNAEVPRGTGLKFEARGIRSNHVTKWFVMGLWSTDTNNLPRESVAGQKDDDGTVETDTLVLNRHFDGLQVRITKYAFGNRLPETRFLGVCVNDNTVKLPSLEPVKSAWDKTIEVPERSQMAYEGGNVLCSPTTVSMLLAFWADKLQRPSLDHDVPEITAAIYDRTWKGTGNWVFNMAFAGSLPGMRAYVTRLSDISELEQWVGAGLPVGLSLCYDLLRGKPSRSSGHLVVCVGFTKDGDPVINDPGTRQNVRKIFPRENLAKAWAYSKNAAYLIYPENTRLPRDRFGHWASAESSRRFSFSTPEGKPPP